jgi:hypothetical protein
MCWNFRNYGNSTSPILKGLNPFNIKIDAEKVLDFVINRLKIKGKIGVYGITWRNYVLSSGEQISKFNINIDS